MTVFWADQCGTDRWTQTPVIQQWSLPHMDAPVWKDLQVCCSSCDGWFYYHILWEQNYLKYMHGLWMKLTLYIAKSSPFSSFFKKMPFQTSVKPGMSQKRGSNDRHHFCRSAWAFLSAQILWDKPIECLFGFFLMPVKCQFESPNQ